MKEYHTLEDILEIIELIGDSKYYLQNFKNSSCVLDKSLTEFTDDELKKLNKDLNKYPNVWIRGIEKED